MSSYDFRNNVLTEKDGKGNVTTNTYDDNGSLIKTVFADNTEINYAYDELNRQKSITGQNGNTTTTTYDSVGNAEKITKPLGITQSMTYDRRQGRRQGDGSPVLI